MTAPIETVCVVKEANTDHGGIIAPSPSNPAVWRLTHYDDRGFRGHEEFYTREETLRTANKTYGLTEPVSEEEFARVASTSKFAAGNELTRFVAKVNSGQPLTDTDQERIEVLNKILQGATNDERRSVDCLAHFHSG
jgi:hypothetical protein